MGLAMIKRGKGNYRDRSEGIAYVHVYAPGISLNKRVSHVV